MNVLSNLLRSCAASVCLVVFPAAAHAQPGYEQGIAYFNAAEYAQAQIFFDTASASFDADAGFHYYRALSLLMVGETEQSLGLMQRAVALALDNADYYYALAKVYEVRTREVGAFSMLAMARGYKASLVKAVTLDPSHLDATMELTTLLLAWPGVLGGDKEAGRALLAQLTELSPAAAWLAEAHALSEDREALARTEALLHMAIAAPESAVALPAKILLAQIYVKNARYREALPYLEQALPASRPWHAALDAFRVPMLLAAAWYHLQDEASFRRYATMAEEVSQLERDKGALKSWFKFLDVDY